MVVTAAIIVAGLRLWMQVRGKTKTPFGEWAIGWGALFLILSLMSEAAPGGAGMLALIVVVGDVLANGATLMTDVEGAITGAEKGQPILTPAPFSSTPTAGNSSGGSTSMGSKMNAVSSANSKGGT